MNGHEFEGKAAESLNGKTLKEKPTLFLEEFESHGFAPCN
jgi:hypothetical protein